MRSSDTVRVQIPFSAYDMFGYLMPGLGLIFGVLLFEYWFGIHLDILKHKPVMRLIMLIMPLLESSNFVLSLLYLWLLVTLVYLVGHTIAAVSGLFVDRVVMNKAYGYPYERLVTGKGTSKKDLPGYLFYRGLFFWLNFSLLLVYVGVFAFLWTSKPWPDVLLLVAGDLGAAGLILGLVFRAAKAGKFNGLESLKRWFHDDDSLGHKLLKWCWAGPHDFFGGMITGYLKTEVSFTEQFRAVFRDEFQKRFRMDPDRVGTNAFWLPYAFITSKSLEHSAILRNWLQLYGFARNLSTSFYLCFVYAVLSMLLHLKVFHAQPVGNETARIGSFLPGVFMLLAFVMWFRYFYLYSGYFSKFAFRSFIVLSEPLAVSGAERRASDHE